MPKSTAENYRLEECTQKIIDLQKELSEAMLDLVNVKCDITRAIHRLGNYDYEDLLVKRYIFCKSWDVISDEMHYSPQHIYRLHGEALKDFYPEIIDRTTFDAAESERLRRCRLLGKKEGQSKEKAQKTVPQNFSFRKCLKTFGDPFKQAEYIYSLIESEV